MYYLQQLQSFLNISYMYNPDFSIATLHMEENLKLPFFSTALLKTDKNLKKALLQLSKSTKLK